MAPFLTYLGFGKDAPQPEPPKLTSVRALPAQWYTSQDMYELERRAFFSRRWLFITHSSRFKQPGEFLRYNIAGFDCFLIMDRKNKINAFHNVCRHRAYKVIETDEQAGKRSILSCRYHGWSYGLDGKLAKAPQYDMLADFDKDKNGLFPIHVHIDSKGFVWINLDAGSKPEVTWEEHFQGVDDQARFAKFNFDDYELDHTYDMTGDYNWKILADNFNECYHCKTTHADVPTFLTIDSHDCEGKDGHIQHDQAPTAQQVAQGYDVNSTYYFPNVSMSVSPHFMMIQKFLPDGPTRSTMHYEVFKNKNSSDEEFKVIAEMYARVMSEDKALCNIAQRNLNAGVFTNGELHPRWEKGPLFFQSTVREVATEHAEKEKAVGHWIEPARQKVNENVRSKADTDLCAGLACPVREEVLAW